MNNDALPKKRIFISYAHQDNSENFVSRLGYALDMYLETFWDIKLQAGPWSEQLIQRIADCDAFTVVMSSGQKDSEWCQKELEIATNCQKLIIPIRKFNNYKDKDLEKYQYAPFTQGFDVGFQRLTELILGEARTAWEYLDRLDDATLINSLGQGILPALIAKEFGDWLIVERLWPIVTHEIDKTRIIVQSPRTPEDVRLAVYAIQEQKSAQKHIRSTNKAKPFLESYSQMSQVPDSDNERAGRFVATIHANVMGVLTDLLKDPNVRAKEVSYLNLLALNKTYLFDTASKLRELIKLHSRRSRYLY